MCVSTQYAGVERANNVALDRPFEFLTMEEFNRLDRRKKTLYLVLAAEKILEMKGDPEVQSLFKDAPLIPGAELPKKPA
jgi:hypothetical protein